VRIPDPIHFCDGWQDDIRCEEIVGVGEESGGGDYEDKPVETGGVNVPNEMLACSF
jgi:hypothetical protein